MRIVPGKENKKKCESYLNTQGPKGETGLAATVSIGTVTTAEAGTPAAVTNSGDEHEAVFDFVIPQGPEGNKGNDGISPTISIYKTTGGYKITIIDKNGEQSFELLNGAPGAKGEKGETGQKGADGKAGADGQNGTNGVSPTVNVSPISGGHEVTISDAQSTYSFNVMDGADGRNGSNGQNGTDGVSPIVTVIEIKGGHRVAITDAQGTKTFDVMDGADGTGGTGASGTADHSALTNRDAADQHPISAITGLQTALDGKQPNGNYLTGETDPTVPAWAKSPNKPTYTAEEVGAAAAEDGKGLSSNDYTDADKTKLASMPEIVVVTFSGATAGSTASMTAMQIAQAVSAGKLVYANLDDAFYGLVSVNQVMAMFAGLTGVNTSKYFIVRNNVLQTPSIATLQATKDKVTELSSSSTDIQYPSAKAVWDALQSAEGTSLGITGATVGQIAKITAVDDTGKPTSWEPVNIPSAGSGRNLRWQHIDTITLTAQTNEIVISKDTNGVDVADYNAVAMKVEFDVPADSTQTDNNGTPWIYPSTQKDNNNTRIVTNIAGWKTTRRCLALAFFGDIDGVVVVGNNISTQLVIDPERKPQLTVMNGVTLLIHNIANHWPIGTIVSLEVLSERT